VRICSWPCSVAVTTRTCRRSATRGSSRFWPDTRRVFYCGGVPALLVCDNLKTGVTRPDRHEPEIDPDYADLAAHYGCSVLPARVRKPRDKAKVEAGVLIAYRLILAPLRNRTFFSLSELNEAIRELLEVLNTPPVQEALRLEEERL